MSSISERVGREHRQYSSSWRCICGWRTDRTDYGERQHAYTEHVAAVTEALVKAEFEQADLQHSCTPGCPDGCDVAVERVRAVVETWQAELDSGAIRDKDARYCWGLAVTEARAALEGGQS